MDLKVREELQGLIDTLTHSGNPSLDEKLMKTIKQHCKTNDLYVNVVYDKLMEDLKTQHSEVRLSSFQVIDQLFQRSHSFRTLICSNCKELIHLVCGIDPLPAPKSVASTLKKTSLLAFKQWVEKFGDGYPKLKLGYNYLQHNKKVDFNELIAASQGELRRQEEREERQRAFLEQRLEKIKEEMEEQITDIRGCLLEMESCFQILVPSFMDFDTIGMGTSTTSLGMSTTSMGTRTIGSPSCSQFDTTGMGTRTIDDDDDSDSETEWDEVIPPVGSSINGLIRGKNVSVATITVPDRVQVSADDNETLIDTLKERYRQLTKAYLPRINKWIEWFTKAGQERPLKEAIDIKARALAAKEKYSELHIIGLEEKEEEGGEEGQLEPQHKTPVLPVSTIQGSVPWSTSYYLKPLPSVGIENDLANDPTTPQAQMKAKGLLDKLSNDTTGTSSERANSSVAAVPFDVDLIHWGESKVPTEFTPTGMDSLHRYWCQEQDLNVSEDFKATLKCRHITFAGQFEPIERACNAPLPSGTLCPRKDRYKCPLHGLIVPRDEHGQPLNDQDTTSLKPQEETGGEIKKKRKGPVKKYPGLTDLKKYQDTPKNRLETKIFNKRTMSRVGKKMDAISKRKGTSKFADNFNYALKS